MRPLLLALVLLAAGCAGPSVEEPPPLPEPAAPPGTLLGTFRSALVEAAVVVDDQDRAYVASVDTEGDGPGPARLWLGPAGGALERRGDVLEGNGDAALAHAGGALFWAGLRGEEGRRIPVQRSTDGGLTWSAPVDASRGSPNGDRQFVAATEDGLTAVVFTGVASGATGYVCVVSQDGGATWEEPRLITTGTTMNAGTVAIHGGRIHVAYGTAVPFALWVATSDDGCRTWIHRLVDAKPILSFPDVAVDAAGTLYVVWSTGMAGPVPWFGHGGMQPVAPAVESSVSRDGGATWSAPLRLTAEGRSGWYPTLAAGAEGQVAVAWYEVEVGRDDGTGLLALAVGGDAASAAPRFTRLDPTPEPVPLGIRCASATECNSTRSVGEILDVALRPDGGPAVAWVQVGDEGLELHYAAPAGAAT